MSKLYTRTETVEAMQWDGDNTAEVLNWIDDVDEPICYVAPDLCPPCPDGYDASKGRLWSHASVQWALPGYWIIKSHYVFMADDHFKRLYTPKEEK